MDRIIQTLTAATVGGAPATEPAWAGWHGGALLYVLSFLAGVAALPTLRLVRAMWSVWRERKGTNEGKIVGWD